MVKWFWKFGWYRRYFVRRRLQVMSQAWLARN